MPMTGLTGSRVRERRLSLGLRQADLARSGGISASYLNLIEHNRRRIGAEVLARLAQALGVEPGALAEGAERDRIEGLRLAAAGAPLGGALRPEVEQSEDLLGRFPGWADLLVSQHQRLAQLERVVAALNDRISHDPHLSAALHEVLSAVSSVRSTAAILAETEDIEPEWRARFHANLHMDSERLALGAEALVAYLDGSEQAEEDPAMTSPQEELEGWLAAKDWHLAGLEDGPAGAETLQGEVAALASGAARAMARDWLDQAASDAASLPLASFEQAMHDLGRDPLRLAQAFGTPVMAAFRRLAFSPGAREGLVICDASGTLVLRKPVEGFVPPRFGAACPLWPLYSALSRPMVPVEAIAEIPGLPVLYFRMRAFCEPSYPGGYGGIEVRQAAMLIEPVARGAILTGGGIGAAPTTLPIGSSCRICPRKACAARREPSILTEFA